ncbi:uncharacterized protein LOC134776931 [Penaeus indicus]|uniref:uncharacterized protein LOC134776931 n=1 Tax=Penaeus indicus TaxID=29960 RepID=UPI00300C923E
MDVPREAVYSLIGKIRADGQLWDPRHRHYKKRALKRMKMVDISRELQQEFPGHADKLTPDHCYNKFHYLRSNFHKQLRRIQNTPSGSSKWEFFTACSFLHPAYRFDSTPSFEMQQNSKSASEPSEELVWDGSAHDLIDPESADRAPEEEVDPLATTSERTGLPSPTDCPSSTSGESRTPTPTNSSFIVPTPPRPRRKRKHNTNDISHTEDLLMQELANVHNEWKNVKQLSAPLDPVLESVKGFVRILNDSHPHLKAKFHRKVFEAMAEISQEFG